LVIRANFKAEGIPQAGFRFAQNVNGKKNLTSPPSPLSEGEGEIAKTKIFIPPPPRAEGLPAVRAGVGQG